MRQTEPAEQQVEPHVLCEGQQTPPTQEDPAGQQAPLHRLEPDGQHTPPCRHVWLGDEPQTVMSMDFLEMTMVK